MSRTFKTARVRRDAGMDLAARRKEWAIRRGMLAFIEALLRNQDHKATTDDATTHLDTAYSDGGRWRGSIPRRLFSKGLIERAGVITSVRASRHAGLVTEWRAVDLEALERERAELAAWLRVNPCPSDPGRQGVLFGAEKGPGAATSGHK